MSSSAPSSSLTQVQTSYLHLSTLYTNSNPLSQSAHLSSTSSLPGGNTRSSIFFPPFPLTILSAPSPSELLSADGKLYIDLLGDFSAGLYGHSCPEIRSAIISALEGKGLSFGLPSEGERKLAERLKERFEGGNVELMRFTNSGTEAAAVGFAAAKRYTGREKVVVFGGGYHGFGFGFRGKEGMEGGGFLLGKYNDLGSVRRLLEENRGEVAAIAVEPMLGSGGAIPGTVEFLEGLRKLANESGAVLIFDEVMTSRMYAGGGIQSRLRKEMRPDLTLLGKYIGGGLAFGAVGGKREIMELFDPRRENSLAHAGTFNNDILTLSAGLAGLEKVFTPRRAEQLHATGERLRERLQNVTDGTMLKVTGCGSIIAFHFTHTPANRIFSPDDLGDVDPAYHGLLHLYLLQKGYHIARRGYVALSLAITDAQLDGFVEAVRAFIVEYRHLLKDVIQPRL